MSHSSKPERWRSLDGVPRSIREAWAIVRKAHIRPEALRLRPEIDDARAYVEAWRLLNIEMTTREASIKSTFTVDMWDRRGVHLEEVAAMANNINVARGAHEAALKHFPNSKITSRNGIMILEQNWPRD
jgi:hypothetical protein